MVRFGRPYTLPASQSFFPLCHLNTVKEARNEGPALYPREDKNVPRGDLHGQREMQACWNAGNRARNAWPFLPAGCKGPTVFRRELARFILVNALTTRLDLYDFFLVRRCPMNWGVCLFPPRAPGVLLIRGT